MSGRGGSAMASPVGFSDAQLVQMQTLLTSCVGNILKSKNVEWDGQVDDKWLVPPAALDTSLREATTRLRLARALHEQGKKSAQIGAVQRKLGACAERVAGLRRQLEVEWSRQTEIEAEVVSLWIAESAAKACVDSLQEELRKVSAEVARGAPADGEEFDEDEDEDEDLCDCRAGDGAAAADAWWDEVRQAELDKLAEAAAAAELERVQELEGIASRKKARLDEAARQWELAEADRVAAEHAQKASADAVAADAATVKAQS